MILYDSIDTTERTDDGRLHMVHLFYITPSKSSGSVQLLFLSVMFESVAVDMVHTLAIATVIVESIMLLIWLGLKKTKQCDLLVLGS